MKPADFKAMRCTCTYAGQKMCWADKAKIKADCMNIKELKFPYYKGSILLLFATFSDPFVSHCFEKLEKLVKQAQNNKKS